MSDVLMFSSVAMLVLLFLKVPVFVAVLGGSLIYFLMNPDINSLIFIGFFGTRLTITRIRKFVYF